MATQGELDAHINVTTNAHTASAINFVAGGTIVATNVQAAIEEVASEPTISRLMLPTFTKNGVLFVDPGTLRLPIDGNYTIIGVRLMVGTAPSGASVVIDVNKNGTTIFSTQGNRPTIAIGANAGGPGTAPDISTIVAGDYLTVDIDQVGSTVTGSDLVVSIIVDRVLV